MPCPFFKRKAICAAHEPDLYVPPREVEIKLCSTDRYAGCRIFAEALGRKGAGAERAGPPPDPHGRAAPREAAAGPEPASS